MVKERAYQSLVRPKLEFSSTTWNPQQVTQKRQIEQIQRNAAGFESNKPFNYQNPTSVTSMAQQLNWLTFEARHLSSDLVLMYKVVHNLVAVPITYHPPRLPRYMNCVIFITYHCCENVYQHSFSHKLLYCRTSYQQTVLEPDQGR